MLVPSGLERPIHYRHGDAPVLAVKLEELFGSPTPTRRRRPSPSPCLLSPAAAFASHARPQRLLERTYPEVKKEVKAATPNTWPDDRGRRRRRIGRSLEHSPSPALSPVPCSPSAYV